MGPLSELYDRGPAFNISNALFVIFSVGAALSTNIRMLVAFRFLAGASVAAIALGPGIVGDLFPTEQRGRAMSIMILAGLIGPTIGPVIGGYLEEECGWRWTFWLPTILNGVFAVVFVLIYRETHKVRILAKRAARMRTETGDTRYLSPYDDNRTAGTLFVNTVARPMRLLAGSPMLMLVTLHISLVCGFLYVVLTTLSPALQEIYHFSEGAAGLAFLGLCIGMVVATFFCSSILDNLVRDAQHSTSSGIERRLIPAIVSGCMLPVAFWYGWTIERHVQWMGPLAATGIIGFCYTAISIAARSYIVDAFGIYSASAISAMLVLRNLVSVVLPLAGPPLYARLGLGWGNSVLGFIALALVPIPLVMVRLGARLQRMEKMKIAT